jgi:hypothetical protein
LSWDLTKLKLLKRLVDPPVPDEKQILVCHIQWISIKVLSRLPDYRKLISTTQWNFRVWMISFFGGIFCECQRNQSGTSF